MPNSLLTGVSGLLAHQRMLDVVGHNIANMNTTAFKSQRILFADLLYETIQPASGAGENQGGTNPNQIGGGVKAALTDRDFSQGALENTGGQFDFALDGPGFFTLTTDAGDRFTRAGTFTLDEQGFLVAPGGLHLKRFTNAGEPDGVNPGFQVPGDPRIQIPLGASIEGVVTEQVEVTGNLNAQQSPPTAQSLRSLRPFTVSGTNAVASDLLNSSDSVSTPYVTGDQIVIEGVRGDGSGQIFTTVDVGPSSTFQDLINEINAAFPEANAVFEQGNIVVRAAEQGQSTLDVSLRNASTNANASGGISLGTHQFRLDVEGKAAGTVAPIVTVYDVQGGSHELTLKFRKQSDDIWSMTAVMDESEGVLLDDTIDNIVFTDSGELLGSGNPTITLQINGIAAPQTITLDFGDALAAERLSHFNSESSLNASSDGSAPGVLTGVQVQSTGEGTGIASNGKVFTLAQLAISSFDNTKGMIALGNNLYQQSLNSGQPNVGNAGAGGRGSILGGQLEASNVDVGTEFTKLIVAQRGFSANARTITISSEVLEELTNIIR